MTTRRDFLHAGLVAGGALAASAMPFHVLDALSGAPQKAKVPLKILVLGGTGFIGPHLVRYAVSRGHSVSTFTRGRRAADLPESVERLVGDRAITADFPKGDLKSLEGRTWDVVFDDSATDPAWVSASTEVLKSSKRYVFVSSTGVFHPYLTANNNEDAPILYDPPAGQKPQYGHNKSRSERVTREAFGDRALIIRPNYIVGPGDTSDRFSYWPVRFAAGGEILVPGKKTDPVQFIDVRDLTAFMVKLVEEQQSGIYNVAGPRTPMQWGTFIAQIQAALKPDATPVWVDDYAFLRANQMTYAIPWMIPEGDDAYHQRIDNRKAVAAGLTFRSIAETVRDTVATWPDRLALLAAGAQPNFRWINADKEAKMLALWKARKAA